MTVGLSGNEYSLGPGDEREFSDAEAGRLIAAGFAAALGAPPAATPAPATPPEPEAAPRTRKRKTKADDVVSGDSNDATGG